jgi:3-phytase
VTLDQAAERIVVVAKAPQGGSPDLELKVNGVDQLGNGVPVRSTAYGDYPVNKALGAGTYNITIRTDAGISSSTPLDVDVIRFEGAGASPPPPPPPPAAGSVTGVVPTAETSPVSHSGDAADDAAIWVNPSDPVRSTIIGTDKLGGIAVYDLAGTQLQYRDQTAKYNNVDLRTNFPLGGQRVALVAASDRTKYFTSALSQYYRSIVLYSVNPATGTLGGPVGTISAAYEPYGLCMYRSQTSGKFYVFVTGRYPVGSLDGYVEQWEISDNGSGQIAAEKVRVFGVGSQTEGCVADDEMGHLYLAEEDVGIWKYPAEPNAGLDRHLVDSTGPEGHLVADVEGLTITYGPNGTGHLLASSQGNSSYTVYRREGSNAYLQTFTVVNGGDTDGTTDTDGIDATTASLGSSFPSGLFVAQDGTNTTPSGTAANQNYKLVPLQHILEP